MPSTSTKLPATSDGTRSSANNNDSDSEESALIVWEDETSKVDFRHLLNEGNANGNEVGGANRHGGEFSGDDDDGGGDGEAEDGIHLRLCATTNGINRRGSRRVPLPVAMTQQIEDMSSGSSSSFSDDNDDEGDNEKQNDKKTRHDSRMGQNLAGKGLGEMVESNETMTPPPHPQRCPKQCNQLLSPKTSGGRAEGKLDDALVATSSSTVAATATAPGSKLKRRRNKRSLMNDAGDIPATTSKLRRQNRGTRRYQQPKTSILPPHLPPPPPSPTTLSTNIIAIPQQVIEKENQPPPKRAMDEYGDENQLSTKEKSEHDDELTMCNDLVSNDVAPSVQLSLTNGSEHTHPPAATKTDSCAAVSDIQQRQQQQQHDLSVSSQYDHANLHHELQNLQQHPSLTKSAPYSNTTCDDHGCRDLFREIELGLDQVCCAPADANATANGNADSNVVPKHLCSNKMDSASNNNTTNTSATVDILGKVEDIVDPGSNDDEEEIWNDDDLAAIDLSVAMVAKLNRPIQQQEHESSILRPSLSPASSSSICNPQQQVSSQKKQPLSLSTTENACPHATNPPHCSYSSPSLSPLAAARVPPSRANLPPVATGATCQHPATLIPVPLPVSASDLIRDCEKTPNQVFSNIDDCGMEDDESWNDDDLAAIDLSVELTRSSFNSTSRPPVDKSSYNGANNPYNFKQTGIVTSEDDDQYFAEMDFDALDDTIVRHHQLRLQQQQKVSMTQDQQRDSIQSAPLQSLHSPPPPPPLAPIFNRRRHLPIEAKNYPNEPTTLPPSYPLFTRYTVQIIQEDLLTCTKTIGVSLWNNPQDDKKTKAGDELDYLMSICMNQSTNDALQKPASDNVVDGYLHLRGEWYHTSCHPGDIIHLCSLSGDYLTGITALPVVLHSDPPPSSDPNDDLLLVLHPDELITPTLVSEAVQCPRLAVLRSRLGSTGMSSRSAVIGILRHELFERCLRERDASHKSAAMFTRQIIRNNANALLGCGVIDQREAFGEVMKTLSQVQLFLQSFTSWNVTKPNAQLQQKEKNKQSSVRHGGNQGDRRGNYIPKTLLKGMFASCDTMVEIQGVYSTEQWMHVPELGLKGNVDATVMARMRPLSPSKITSHGDLQDSLLPVELKTGHVQNPTHNHLAQLSIYTMMLRARQGSCNSFVQSRLQNMSNKLEKVCDVEAVGAASSGMLLYLNHESYCARHVKPTLNDVKTLMGQRNKLASNAIRASRPRGITIKYEADEQNRNKTGPEHGHGRSRVVVRRGIAPPSALPELQHNINSCERCYKNRECMMYASADMNSNIANSHSPTLSGNSGHKRLLDHFTGHLQAADLDYFCKWDMLIDIERHASSKNVLTSWLYDSDKKETKDGKCISSLMLAEFVTEGGGVIVDIDSGEEEEDTLIRFVRSNDATHTTPLSNLNFEVGSHAIISEDGTSLASKSEKDQKIGVARHEMHILRGAVVRIGQHEIDIAVPSKDIARFKRLVKWRDDTTPKNPATSQRNGEHSNINIVVKKFRLDKDDYFGLFGLLLQNLVNFFTLDIPPFSAESFGTPVKTKSLTADTDMSDRRRRLNSCIVQLKPAPRFLNISVDSIFCVKSGLQPGCDQNILRRDFDRLNSDQKEAVLKVIAAEDFALIQGLPGTGKSETISFITRLLVRRGKRVLLTSYTHSAVDNLLCKLMESDVIHSCTANEDPRISIIRIGQVSSCHPQVRPILAHAVARETERIDSGGTATSIEQPSVEYLHKVISAANVVGVSALTAPRSPLLAGQHFDVVIVDEAGQISQPAVLGAIMAADSFVLVGDHMQLPPLVISEVAEEGGMNLNRLLFTSYCGHSLAIPQTMLLHVARVVTGFGTSMLKRLADAFPGAIAKLTMQYRMNESICHLSNVIGEDMEYNMYCVLHFHCVTTLTLLYFINSTKHMEGY